MATFTSVPQATSFQFKHYEPTSLKRTQSKPKAKTTGHTHRRDRGEVVTPSLGLLYQESEGDLPAVHRQTLQVQTTGRVEDVEHLDSGMYDLFGAGHGTCTFEFTTGDSNHQFRHEVCDEGEKDHATLDLALNKSFNESNFHPIGESDATRDHHSATTFQRGNGNPDHQDKSYDLTTANGRDHAKQCSDIDAAVGYAFSVEDFEGTYHERPLAEDETLFGVASVMNGPSTTRKHSHQSSVVDATTTILEAVPNVISDLEPENPHPVKRRRTAERQARSPIIEPTHTPKPMPLLDPSDEASRPSISGGTIPGPLGADRKEDGTTSLTLPPTDLRDVEDGDGACVQGAVEELLQARRSITPSERLQFEQDVGRESDRSATNRQDSGSQVGEVFEEEHSHNEASSIPPSRSQRHRRRTWTPEMGRNPSNNSLRPLDYNTVPTRAPQRSRMSQPQQNLISERRGTDKDPQTYFPESNTPGTTADDRTNIDYECDPSMSCQITDLALCTIPNGCSVVTAMLRPHNSNCSLDVVALGHKVLGEQVKVIRMTQLSPDSWVLLGYRCNDSTLNLCNGQSLNAECMNGFHNDAANQEMGYSDDENCDEENENEEEEESAKECSQRTHKLWLESEEVLLLSLKDKQGMGWEEVCKRFPNRSPGAVKLRYYTLKKKGL
ncbi:hypothetical protein G6011_09574 [Alternaria panax]|uniref:Myb-like domain-containing protein n=1 Tax=Alternaria panax TaxID=48097 RepID=A0AAD4FC42_9PLEO|nr:hypothetical protein G6011_09574 [Alternaria panax]